MPSTAVVIGTGPGGSAAAWSLSRAGVDVTLIEAGPRYVPPRDYRLDAPDWELSRFPEKVSTQGRQSYAPLQPLEAKHSELRSWNRVEGRLLPGDQRHFMTYSHVVGVGGSTLHYAGESHRMHPGAMKMFSDYGVGADWPISYADLEPYYELAERLIGVAGPATDPQRPRRSPCPMAPHEMSYSTTVLGRGCKKLGLSWRPNPVAAASRAYDGRPPCNYCGQCGRGCPRLDKGTADLTLIPKALATGHCRLLTEMQALQIETDGRDRVRAVVCADGNGTRHRFKADAVVIACGAIETPRLLLNSSAASAPEGLANESGQIGKNFLETVFWTSVALHPEPLGSYRGLPSDAICWDYSAPDAIPGVIGGARFSPGTL
jgi:choline dehydrogenase-like flavoprotein